MEKLTMNELVYAYRLFSEMKKPSTRVKQMIEKLEEHLHHTVMGLRKIDSRFDPPL